MQIPELKINSEVKWSLHVRYLTINLKFLAHDQK